MICPGQYLLPLSTSVAMYNEQLQALQQQPPSLTSVAGVLFATFFPVASCATLGQCMHDISAA